MKSVNRTSPSGLSQSRRGSAMVVVLALLALLAILGFTFYTFSAQERAAAEYFASESRNTQTGLPDTIFDWPLRQILIGPDDSNYYSVLWGGRHSLVPNMIGTDRIPFNGEGINLIDDGTGAPVVDMDYDVNTLDNPTFISPVDSPAANGGVQWGAGKSLATLPAPDTDYSAPDINSMLLSYDGYGFDTSNTLRRVIIPTLMRPQLFNRSGGAPVTNWYDNAGVIPASKSFRPHPDHQCLDANGALTGDLRYVATQNDANTLGLNRPFTFAPVDDTGAPTNGEMGIWSGSPDTLYNLDVDTDGDGIKDAILVDLGYPPFRRGDGKLVVPLFAMQIRDLNGLLNLNTTTSTLSANPFPPTIMTQEFGADAAGNPRYLSSSNQGLAPSEINSLYGLATTLPTSVTPTDLQQYRFFLKTLGGDRDPMSAREIANIEWFFLVYGRPHFNPETAVPAAATAAAMSATIESITPGLLGDTNYLLTFLSTGSGSLPQPGRTTVNDNIDTVSLYPFFWTNQTAEVPPKSTMLGTPLDLLGSSTFLLSNSGGLNPFGKYLNTYQRATQPLIGPNRWLIYNSFHSRGDVFLGRPPTLPTNVASDSTYAAQLMPFSFNQLLDDPSEIIADIEALKTAKSFTPGTAPRDAVDNDAVFDFRESAFLQLSNVDGSVVKGSSRLASLAPVNTVAAANAPAIRSQYTTVSSDRREYSKVTTSLTTPTAQMRSWESSYLAVLTTVFRPVVWYQLSGKSTFSSKQFKLSANQVLVDNTGEPFPAGAVSGLQFRDLTPHPSRDAVLPSAAISTTPVVYSGPNFGAAVETQEYFARRDRQALARDIYTLLYLYGAGLDQDPSLASPVTYTDAQLKEMAQFAVNYVDALDRDSVMTRFEYDKNLSNGWTLDDNPYTTTDGPGERGEVWGVEAQQLTFSEALAFRGTARNGSTPIDHPATSYDDTTDRYFTYVDLQSSSPYLIDFAVNPVWQVRILPKGDATPLGDERRLRPLVGQVLAGGTFSILTAGDNSTMDTTNTPSSYCWVAPTGSTKVRVAPAVAPPTPATPATANSLDLITDLTSSYEMTDGALAAKTARGDFHNVNNAMDPDAMTPMSILFTLMRRADPFRAPPAVGATADELDNPWVEVDRIRLGSDGTTSGLKKFDLLSTTNDTSMPNIIDKLKQIFSRYRVEPFAADFDTDFDPANIWGNSSVNFLGTGKYIQANPAPTAQFTQFHFDRPFASLGELLNIPLVGPGLYSPTDPWYVSGETWHLTRALTHANESPLKQVSNGTPQGVGGPDKRAMTAAGKFLQADFPDSVDASLPLDNRWYRLLEFLEVPSPMNRYAELHAYAVTQLGLPGNFGWPRSSGQLNLNFIRHSSVLGGLLDDNFVLDESSTVLSGRDTTDAATYNGAPATRSWWVEFLRSRDTLDPVTHVTVPGMANARPFRGFNFTGRGKVSQSQDTLFRTLPDDAQNVGLTDKRHLFEIGQQTEHVNGTLDSLAKNRLLSKIMNNVTTRTNTYGVFIAVQYFEAGEAASGAIRIGGKLDDMPTQRGFFILDRTAAVEQVKDVVTNMNNSTIVVPAANQATFPRTPNTFSFTPNTDTSGILTQQNGIKWEDLVLYRQIFD